MAATLSPSPDVPHIRILVSPTGEEWYDAYGPMTKDREQATRFVRKEVADSWPDRYGSTHAFWQSELRARDAARKEFRNWTYRSEPYEQPPP